MGIKVAVFDKTMAYGDDGNIFEFTDGDDDLLPFVRDWMFTPSFSHMEIWRDED